ncbi:MAG: restriction endonuclease subunit S [Gammaproteobacteria bacterium]
MTKKSIPVDLRSDHWKLVCSILREHVPDRDVLAFGSRAKWTAREYSDLDLVIKGNTPLPLNIKSELSYAFTESNLPFKVDVVDWATSSPSFREIISRDSVVAQAAQENTPPDGWQKVKLGNIADITMGQSPKSEFYNTDKEGLPFLQGSAEFGSMHPTHKKYSSDWNKESQQGDILMSVRAPVGDINIANMKYAIGRGLASIKGKNENTQYIFYLLKSASSFINDYASGTVFTAINKDTLKDISFLVPPLPEQHIIAYILGTLDDKIELNQKMNQTLEATGKAIFKSWFVDFDPVHAKVALSNKKQKRNSATIWTVERARTYLDSLDPKIVALFPDSFVDSEIGKIPKGWQVSSVKSKCQRLKVEKPYSNKTTTNMGNIPVLDQTEDGIIGFHSEEKYIPASLKKPVITFANHTCNMRLLFNDFSVIQNVIPILPVDHPIGWFYFRTLEIQKPEEYKGHILDFMDKILCFPEVRLANEFESIVEPILHRIYYANEESKVLLGIRDTLLPKLVSGTIRVHNVRANLR